jgi:hypothetical protein
VWTSSTRKDSPDGLFIGIVDTGVDYNHPALGGGFGPGYKVVTRYDLVGDAYDGTTDTTPVPDNDPVDCDGHGTHVSGINGADPNPFNFTGVVPNATLGMWKVFGCTGSVGNDILIAAFNMAYEADYKFGLSFPNSGARRFRYRLLSPDCAVGDASEVAVGKGQTGSREPCYGVGEVIKDQDDHFFAGGRMW